MSRVALVLSFEVVDDATGHGRDVKLDPQGGQPITAEHFAGAGDDAPPLAGDYAVLTDDDRQVVGYADVRTPAQATGGEKRIYARDASGAVVADVYLRKDGKIVITGASITIKGDVRVEGALAVTGEVTGMVDLPTAVKLTTHQHITPVGPSQPPTPGT